MNKVEIIRYGTTSVCCPESKRYFPLVNLYDDRRASVKCKYHERIGLQHIYCKYSEEQKD